MNWPFEAAQQLHQPLGFFAPDAGHRFIEQEQLRLHGERDGKFQRALLAVGKFAGRQMRPIGNAGLFERRHGRNIERGLVGGAPEKAQARAVARLNGERNVLQHRKTRQDRGDLKAPRQSAHGARFRR